MSAKSVNAIESNCLEMRNITFTYGKEKENHILEDVSYSFLSGKMYALLGESGIGKTTTLAILGALDYPDQGEVLYNGKTIKEIGYNQYRRNVVGFIFQDYNLLSYLSGYKNIELALGLTKQKGKNINEYLAAVAMDEKTAGRNVKNLSGGEQQRIAIARALAKDSKVILADEPTGNLDSENAEAVIAMLSDMANKQGKCVIAVTHTKELAEKADVIIRIKEHKIV